jgi:hypothetical protein
MNIYSEGYFSIISEFSIDSAHGFIKEIYKKNTYYDFILKSNISFTKESNEI